MSQVSRPVLIALAAVVAFAGAWFTVLAPKPPTVAPSPSAAPSAPGATGLKKAVDKAHGVVNDSNRAPGVAHPVAPAVGAPVKPGTAAPAPSHAAPARPAAPAFRYHGAVGRVERALAAHRTVAMLFYNPASPDDRAVKGSLAHVNRFHGRVATFSAPITQLFRYRPLTTKVAVFGSPTVVIVAPSGEAGALTGFVDPVELQQRIDDAVGPATRGHHRRRAAHRTHHTRAAHRARR